MPSDHEMFNGLKTAQWLWYYYNLIEDDEKAYTGQRDLVEYHASFIEPEAVRKIREAREESVEVPHDEFVAGIEYFFGKKINLSRNKRKGAEMHTVVSPGVGARSYKQQKERAKKERKPIDYESWLNMSLE